MTYAVLTINNIDCTDLLKNVFFFKYIILFSYFIKHNITAWQRIIYIYIYCIRAPSFRYTRPSTFFRVTFSFRGFDPPPRNSENRHFPSTSIIPLCKYCRVCLFRGNTHIGTCIIYNNVPVVRHEALAIG